MFEKTSPTYDDWGVRCERLFPANRTAWTFTSAHEHLAFGRRPFGRHRSDAAASERVALVNSREGEPERCECSLARSCKSLAPSINFHAELSINFKAYDINFIAFGH